MYYTAHLPPTEPDRFTNQNNWQVTGPFMTRTAAERAADYYRGGIVREWPGDPSGCFPFEDTWAWGLI